MALNERELLKLKKLLKDVNDLRAQFGEESIEVKFDEASQETFKVLADMSVTYKNALEDANEAAGDLYETTKANLAEVTKTATAQQQYVKGLKKTQDLSRKLYDDAKGLNELKGKEVKNLVKAAELELARRQELMATLDVNDDLYKRMKEELNLQDELVKKAKARLKEERKIEKAMGLSGAAVKGVVGALGKIGINSSFFEDLSDDMRSAAKSGSKLNVAFAGVKGLAKGIGEALSDPLVIIGLLVKSVKFLASIFTGMRKSAAEIGAQIGGPGQSIYNQLDKAGNAAGDMYNTTEELKKSYLALNEVAGRKLLATDTKRLKTFNEMVQYMGFSVEQAKAFANISMVNGQSMGDMNQDLENVVNSLDAATGNSVLFSDVVEKISGASASTRRSFQGNFKAMVATAHTAARLGVSMDQIANAARKTLDFQSSIEDEMSVEMMLGRSINLEKLRHATLTRDAATMAEEQRRLVKETMADTAHNQILLEQTAALLGMSVEEYESIAENIDKESKMTGQQLLDQKKKLAAQKEEAKESQALDRAYASMMNSLKSALKPIAEKIFPIIISGLEKVTAFLGSNMGKILLGLAGLAAGVGIGMKVVNKITGGMFERGATPVNPQYVYNVNESGGGGDFMSNFVGRLGSRWVRSMGLTKKLSNLFKGKNSVLGRQLRNLSAMFGRRSSFVNQIVRNNKTLSQLFPKLSTLNSKLPQNIAQQIGKTLTVDKAGNVLRTADAAADATRATSLVSKAGPLLTKVSKVLGPVGVVADIGLGAYSGYQAGNMTAEEQRAANIREGTGKFEGTTLGILTGGAERGSILTNWFGGEKGSVGDEALGIGTSAARGAALGAGIGTALAPFTAGISIPVSAAIGAVVGTVSEGFKVLSDPNSAIRKKISAGLDWMGEQLTAGWENMKEFGSKIYDSLSSAASTAWESTKEIASSAYESVKDLGSRAWEGIKDFGSSAWEGVKSVGSYINPMNWFATGGIAPGGFQAFANGGTVTSPTLGMVGEGGMNEAIVPLPDGRSIPVQMAGGGEVATLLKQLISIVSQGGDVYLDGNKVGQALALGTSRMG